MDRKIKYIFFDFFGIFSPDTRWAWFANHIKHREIDEEAFSKMLGKLDRGEISEEEMDQFVSSKIDLSANEVAKGVEKLTNINQEIVSLIEKLKPNYKIGLLSNAASKSLHAILTKYNLDHLFDSVTISADIGHKKPEPEIYQIALKSLNAKAEESIFIDDREKYTNAAKKLGFVTIHFKSVDLLIKELIKIGVKI